MSSGGDAVALLSNPPESDCPTSADRLRVQLGLKPAELRPYHAVEGRFAGPRHDGRAPLPRVAEGTQAVLAADGGEQPDRPHVGQREPEFRRRLVPRDCWPAGTGPPPWRAVPGVVRHLPSRTADRRERRPWHRLRTGLSMRREARNEGWADIAQPGATC